jgi:DnaJ-domain-containing protein 1
MRQSLRCLLVCTVIIPIFTVTVLGAGLQVGTSDPGSATAIEQALIEHACSTTRTAGAPDTDAYHECLSAQLLSLRNDLGRDLGRLSSAERRTLDSVCSDIRAAAGREAYLECLSARLTALRNRRKSATPAPSPGTALTPPPVIAPVSPTSPVRHAASWSSGLWIGATLLTLFAAVGGVLFAMKARPVLRRCRVCGEVPESGDLCQKCRHEAAEAVRGAALARADQQRAQAEEERQPIEHGEEHRGQNALQEEEAGLRQQEEAVQPEEDSPEREEAREPEDLREREQVFDPYAVLGVPPGATKEDIDAAYQEGKLKYDPDQVAHLSAEVQEHYKAKAQQVDRAHQKLTE